MASLEPSPDTRTDTQRRLTFSMQQSLPTVTIIDRLWFLIGLASAVWIAVLVAIHGVTSWPRLLLLVPVWAIVAYIALPRLHRLLSDLYVPDYFFGRTRTADGLLGDPVNLACDGTVAQLDEAMTRAGWHRADEITLRSSWGIVVSTLTGRSYPTAPVSPLMLFGRRHDLAYQQEVEGSARQRHHVRFWHCPPGWLLPGGAKVDWLGAATFDTDVGLSLFTLQFTHRIDANTDVERDYVVNSVLKAVPDASVRELEDFTTGYHARNGGGDRFITDGDLPILDVRSLPESTALELVERVAHPQRPLSVVAGATAVVLSVVVAIVELVSALASQAVVTDPDDVIAIEVAIGIIGALLLVEIVCAVLVLRGGRRSRYILLMLLAVIIALTAVTYATGDASVALDWSTLTTTLLSAAMIALSSESAGRYALLRSQERKNRA